MKYAVPGILLMLFVSCTKTGTQTPSPLVEAFCENGSQAANLYLGFFDYKVPQRYKYNSKGLLTERVGTWLYSYNSNDQLSRVTSAQTSSTFYEFQYNSSKKLESVQYIKATGLIKPLL